MKRKPAIERTEAEKDLFPWPPKELSPNARVHWRQKARKAAAYRRDCYLWAKGIKLKAPEDGGVMHITFFPPDKRKRDDDNLISSFKNGRDGIADALGIDDSLLRVVTLVGEVVKGGGIRVHVMSEHQYAFAAMVHRSGMFTQSE